MKKKLILCLLICFSTQATQAQYFQVTSIGLDHYKIPLVYLADAPLIAQNINQVIQEELDIPYFQFGDSVFQKKNLKMVYVKYWVELNNYAVLSFGFSLAHFGNRSNRDTLYLNFNSVSGQLLSLDDLLQPDSFNILGSDIKKYYSKEILDFVVEYNLEYGHDDVLGEAFYSLIQYYCNTSIKKFLFTNSGIIVNDYPDFPGAAQVATQINWVYFIEKVKLDTWKYKLTTYGKYILQSLE